MTAKELCALVGITEANLSILRSGKASGVRFHTINRICYYLNCDVGDILRFDGYLDFLSGRVQSGPAGEGGAGTGRVHRLSPGL